VMRYSCDRYMFARRHDIDSLSRMETNMDPRRAEQLASSLFIPFAYANSDRFHRNRCSMHMGSTGTAMHHVLAWLRPLRYCCSTTLVVLKSFSPTKGQT
jgi:hypothetical protein